MHGHHMNPLYSANPDQLTIKMPTLGTMKTDMLKHYQLDLRPNVERVMKQLAEKQERTAEQAMILAQNDKILELEAKLAGHEVDENLESILYGYCDSQAVAYFRVQYSKIGNWTSSIGSQKHGRFKSPSVDSKREALILAVSWIEEKMQ